MHLEHAIQAKLLKTAARQDTCAASHATRSCTCTALLLLLWLNVDRLRLRVGVVATLLARWRATVGLLWWRGVVAALLLAVALLGRPAIALLWVATTLVRSSTATAVVLWEGDLVSVRFCSDSKWQIWVSMPANELDVQSRTDGTTRPLQLQAFRRCSSCPGSLAAAFANRQQLLDAFADKRRTLGAISCRADPRRSDSEISAHAETVTKAGSRLQLPPVPKQRVRRSRCQGATMPLSAVLSSPLLGKSLMSNVLTSLADMIAAVVEVKAVVVRGGKEIDGMVEEEKCKPANPR